MEQKQQPPATVVSRPSEKDKLTTSSVDDEKRLSASDVAPYEPDGIHDGLEFPTDEERETLRRVPDSIPWAAYRAFFSLYGRI